LDLKGRPVPQGRLQIGRDAILDNFQPSLRDWIMFHDVPRTSGVNPFVETRQSPRLAVR
jgi:hypothetical protein